MITKLIELRDSATFIPCLAIRVSGEDGYLARRAGYGEPCVLFGRLQGGRFAYDPYEWKDRTFKTAHNYIIEHFDDLKDGQVVDVEHILGETKSPKRSEEFFVHDELKKLAKRAAKVDGDGS